MKALILGAGYGTRLNKGFNELIPELQERYKKAIVNKPKPLVEVAGKPLVEYLLEKIEKETKIKDVYIVTNNHFFGCFEQWLEKYPTSLSVKIFDDGSTSNEDRLGVMGDIKFVVEKENIDDHLLILAGDTLFEMDFGDLVNYFNKKERDVISVYEEDPSLLHRRGIVLCNEEGRITDFLEKPENPPTNLAAPIAYAVTKNTLRKIPDFLTNDYDLEDNLIERLMKSERNEVYTFRFEKRYDIGAIEDFINIDEEFSRRFGK